MHRRTINFLVNLGEDVQERKYSLGFLLDLSGSMQGEPLEKVKIAINNLLKPLVTDHSGFESADEVSIFTFHSVVRKLCPWVEKDDFDFFREFLIGIEGMSDALMKGSGSTAIYDGIFEILSSCYKEAKSDNERVVLIFSDGCECGDQVHSESDVKELAEKYKTGFVPEADVNGLISSSVSGDLDKILVKAPGKDYYFFVSNIDEDTILKIIGDPAQQSLLINHLRTTRRPVRICSLYYRDPGAPPEGRDLLQRFADLTGGLVFDAPSPESIPGVMRELFHKLEYRDKSGIREGLLRRLKNCDIENSDDWFRVFSVNHNYGTPELKDVENRDKHTIFNFSCEPSDKREEVLHKFSTKYDGPFLTSLLTQNFNLQNQGLGKIQANPFVNIVFRGNDLTGSSLPLYLYQLLDTIRKDPNDVLGTKYSEYHVFLVILLDKLIHYTEEDKKNLAAFLNEVNVFDKGSDRIHGIFLLSDRNDHHRENPDGFKTLSGIDYEGYVVESLFNLNAYQELPLKAYDMAFNARRSDAVQYNRFLSAGNVSLFADREEFFNKVSGRLCHDFLLNLYEEAFKTDEKSVQNETELFCSDTSFQALKTLVLQNPGGVDLLSSIDCPTVIGNGFTQSWKEIRLKFLDHTRPGQMFTERILVNHSFVDYIRHLYFDVRNYVEGCHAPGAFINTVNERVNGFLTAKFEQLRNTTDRFFYSDDESLSSPKQAGLWIETLFAKMDDYIRNGFISDFSNDPDVIRYNNFEYKTRWRHITDDNPEMPLSELRKKLESYPLPLSSRMKFYSLSMLLLGGIFLLLNLGISPVLGFGLLAFPVGVAIWGEYKIRVVKAQIQDLIRCYGLAHRNRARKAAMDYLRERLSEALVELKNKVRKETENESYDNLYPEDLSENDYFNLFKNAATSSLPKYFRMESLTSVPSGPFNIDLTGGLYDGEGHMIEILDGHALAKMAGVDKISWNELQNKLLSQRESIIRQLFPSVKLSFIPPGFGEQLKSMSQKPNINTSMKLQLYEVIPERQYILTLLDALTTDEVSELKRIYDNKMWHQKIDLLINLFAGETTVEGTNFYALWRDVGFYQAWLNKVTRLVASDDEDSSRMNGDFIFNLWKKMYRARKEFRIKLMENVANILKFRSNARFDLWEMIVLSGYRNNLTGHLRRTNFSGIYLTNSSHSYSDYHQLNYLAEEKYLSVNLMAYLQKNLKSLLQDNRTWSESGAGLKDSLLFNHLVVIPVEDNSLLRNLAVILKDDVANSGSVDWKDYFLKDFCEHYLKTQKQRKEFKWLFSQS